MIEGFTPSVVYVTKLFGVDVVIYNAPAYVCVGVESPWIDNLDIPHIKSPGFFGLMNSYCFCQELKIGSKRPFYTQATTFSLEELKNNLTKFALHIVNWPANK